MSLYQYRKALSSYYFNLDVGILLFDVLEEMLNIKDDRAHEDIEDIFEEELLRRKHCVQQKMDN
jgi:hypothetical protein